MKKVKVLCSGWLEPKTMYLTEKQIEEWENNPLVLDLEVEESEQD